MDLSHIDLNLLVAFDALMDAESVTAAARRLSVGQSAMSSTLARLRVVLDDPLLERRGRAMVPTPLAKSLVVPIRRVLYDVNAILTERPGFDATTARRTFTVMASEYAALAVLQPLMVELRRIAPSVGLHILQVSTDFVDDLSRDLADLVIIPSEFGPNGGAFAQLQLYVDPYVVAVDLANPRIGDALTLEQFSASPYLTVDTGSTPTLVEDQLDRLGVERRLEVTTGFGLAPFLLRDTLLITLLPLSFASAVAEGARLKLLAPPMPLEPLIETLFWSDRKNEDAGHRWFRERIASVAAQRMRSTSAKHP